MLKLVLSGGAALALLVAACSTGTDSIIQVPQQAAEGQFTTVPDSVKEVADTIVVAGDTTIVLRVDTVLQPADTVVVEVVDTILAPSDTVVVQTLDTVVPPPDTVLVEVTDTVVVGGDTVFESRVDTTVVFDTVVVTAFDTSFVFDTVVVQRLDTILQIDTVVFNSVDTVVAFDTVVVVDTVTLPLPRLEFGVETLSIEVGETRTVQVTLINSLGVPVNPGQIQWVSTNGLVVTVDQSGTMTGLSVGQAEVIALSQDGIAARLPVVVTDPQADLTPTGFRANQPSGWTAVTDYGFDDPLPPHVDGAMWVEPMGSSGWTAVDWGNVGGGIRSVADANSPYSPGAVLEEEYPAGLIGAGPSKWYTDLGGAENVYISWIVKWDAEFDHNEVSEKQIYGNLGQSDYFIFQFQWGVEMFYNIQEDTGYSSLRANQLPPNASGHGDAPPVNGRWVEYEFLFRRSTGTVKWWRDGVLHGDHTGRVFSPIRELTIASTWGGRNREKVGTHSRYTDHIFVAVGN